MLSLLEFLNNKEIFDFDIPVNLFFRVFWVVVFSDCL